ncbi:amidohydrolase family protein [Parasphingopyxis marina]|uniref:Amidohydrolase n=1 Tax=Parasphingopyxis marina TaxID=2761622 RepID=A0A842HXJ0_9SPHN|nr:amidohydrolase family protein [Parasphingopyxis marina]MBC2778868.1 amidohydrolase [Parasphingopyxis marina]
MPSPSIRLFDTHIHLSTSDVARFPVDPSGAKEGEAAILRRARSDPVSIESVLPIWDSCHVAGGAAVQYYSLYKTDNSYSVAVADAHPDRLSAVVMLDAADLGTPRKLRALAQNHNVSGIRLFGPADADGCYPWLDTPMAVRVWEEAAALGLAMILMYAGGPALRAAFARIAALADRLAPMPVILDHFGWPGIDEGVHGALSPEHRALADTSNIRFKLSQINLKRFESTGVDSAEFLRHAVDIYGADRIMWGSDYGNTAMAYERIVEAAIAATGRLDERERDSVLHGNGARLFAPRS